MRWYSSLNTGYPRFNLTGTLWETPILHTGRCTAAFIQVRTWSHRQVVGPCLESLVEPICNNSRDDTMCDSCSSRGEARGGMRCRHGNNRWESSSARRVVGGHHVNNRQTTHGGVEREQSNGAVGEALFGGFVVSFKDAVLSLSGKNRGSTYAHWVYCWCPRRLISPGVFVWIARGSPLNLKFEVLKIVTTKQHITRLYVQVPIILILKMYKQGYCFRQGWTSTCMRSKNQRCLSTTPCSSWKSFIAQLLGLTRPADITDTHDIAPNSSERENLSRFLMIVFVKRLSVRTGRSSHCTLWWYGPSRAQPCLSFFYSAIIHRERRMTNAWNTHRCDHPVCIRPKNLNPTCFGDSDH